MIMKFKKSPSFSLRSKRIKFFITLDKDISSSSLEYLPPPNLYHP
jgi:hypothetical protein